MTVVVQPLGWVIPVDFQGTGLLPCVFVSNASIGLSADGSAWLKANLLNSSDALHILPLTAPRLCAGSSVHALGGRFSFVGTILPPGVPKRGERKLVNAMLY